MMNSAAAYTDPIMPEEITVQFQAGPPPGRAFRSGIWPVLYDGNEYWINAEVSTALPYNDQVWAVAEAAARQIRVSKEVQRAPPGPPSITSSLTAQANTGTAFTYQITATSRPTSFDATGLPAGLSVNTSNGRITGIPTATGTFPIQISATNVTGTDTQTLTLTVSVPVPVVSTGAITGTVGTAITMFQIVASNPPILSYAVTPALPAGLSLNTTNGQITGTPTGASSGTFQITATNAGGTSIPRNLTINIAGVSAGWEVTNEMTGSIVVLDIFATKAALGPVTGWTSWQPAYQADMTDDLYNAATPAAQTVRLFAHFTPYATTPEVEVPFDNFTNPTVTGNAIRQWGYDSGDNTVYLDGGQNGTSNAIRLRLVKS